MISDLGETAFKFAGEVDLYEGSWVGLWTCTTCYATVMSSDTDKHWRWHTGKPALTLDKMLRAISALESRDA